MLRTRAGAIASCACWQTGIPATIPPLAYSTEHGSARRPGETPTATSSFGDPDQRLHSQAALREAIQATSGLKVAATQTFKPPRSSTAERLRAQAEGRHYSAFSLYMPGELRASIATFLARLPSPEVCWVDEHLLVVAGASRRNQGEPDRLARRARQAIKDQAVQISAAPVRPQQAS